MASIPESGYFPPLDKCLAGELLLISWRTASSAILRPDTHKSDEVSTIEHFLSSPDVSAILSHPFSAFPGPSQQTRSAFDAKTSAINVTPSSNARYDTKEIKEDALWLSKEAAIDEVSALRVVIVEWQFRTYAQLLDRLSSEELAGIQEAAGQSQSYLPTALFSQATDAKTTEAAFNTPDSRRSRILRTYLSERRHLLKCVDTILQKSLHERDQSQHLGGKGKSNEAAVSKIVEYGQSLVGLTPKETETVLLEFIEGVGATIKRLDSGSGWYKEDGGREDIETEWINSQITEATSAMELIFQTLHTIESPPSSNIVLAWLGFVTNYTFFDGFTTDDPLTQSLLSSLQSIAAVISLSVLNVRSSVGHINSSLAGAVPSPGAPGDSPYIQNLTTISQIHNMIMEISDNLPIVASPMVLGWSIILQEIRLRVENNRLLQEGHDEDFAQLDRQSPEENQMALESDPYQSTMMEVTNGPVEDPIQHLALTAVDACHVFEVLSELALRFGDTSQNQFSRVTGTKMRAVILDLVSSSSAVGYIPEVVITTLSALTGGMDYFGLTSSRQVGVAVDPMYKFLNDDELLSSLLAPAKARYPYESLPFLKLARALAACSTCYGAEASPSMLSILEKMPSFTYTLPDGFSAYETTHEEDNNNSIRLTRPVQLFESRLRTLHSFNDQSSLLHIDQDLCLLAGTYGRMVSETNPKVALWFHEYSGLKYTGKLLETFLSAGDQLDATTGGVVDRDSVSEIIGLYANLIGGLSIAIEGNRAPKDAVCHVLESASGGLSRSRDFMSVVFDIFEEELEKQSAAFGSEVPLEVLISCVQFIHALIPHYPRRVWPLLGRSGLLDINYGGSRLSSIVESVELVSGRYEFLLSCTHLFEALVDDFINNSARRKTGTKSSTRFTDGDVPGMGVPDQSLSKVLLAFTRYLVDVFEGSCTWKFVNQEECKRLSKGIATAFDKILHYAYGHESSDSAPKGLEPSSTISGINIISVLEPAASHITDSFLSTSSGALRFQPFLRAFYNGFNTPDSTFFPNESRLCAEEVSAVLSFTKSLLRASVLLEKSSSQLRSQLFKISPLIARLYAADDSYRIPVVGLLEALVISASNDTAEPPSLLGNLGPRTSRNLLHVLSDFDKPLSRDDNFVGIMHFVSAVVSNRQQWFANYLLTARSSRDAARGNSADKGSNGFDTPLLDTALEGLSAINETPKRRVLATLEFVALAQNFWPWATYGSQKHAEFIKSISEFMGNLKPIQPSTAVEGPLGACYQTRIAAYAAEILAMHLFHSRQTGKSSVTDDMVSNLGYFTRFGVAVPTYNYSLHGNLKRNFDAHFTGCRLSDFQRTGFETRELGQKYFYDLSLADELLSHHASWGIKNGFRSEIVTANVNLSLVDAQVALLHSWKFLAAELSNNISGKVGLQISLARVAGDCLVSNRRNQGPEEIFGRLSQTRADLALILIQRLVEAKSTVPEMAKLLDTVWETIRQSDLTFELALGSDPSYYRTLLKLLFLALRIHVEAKVQPQSTTVNFRASLRSNEKVDVIPTTLGVLHRVVANGLRDLSTFIHQKPAESSPADLALLTAILQACLHIPGIELSYAQIVSTFVQNDSARVATTLFTWSDSLAIDGDPIYGELSILFLLELSNVPTMAEQLAIDGVLGHIGAANITSYLRKSNVNPFAEGTGFQRCYNIWVRGILPLLLHLLDAVGASVATEVSAFLNQFPNLLEQSAQAFDAPELSRTASKAQVKYITLGVCSEIHTLSLIMFILNGYRESSTGHEIPEVKWDAAAVLENVDIWLGSLKVLGERIIPMDDRELALAKKKAGGDATNKLEERVIAELYGIRDVLGGGEA